MGICAHAIIGLIKLLHPKKVCFPSRIRTKHFQIKKHFHWTIRDEADGWEYPWVPSPHDLWCTFLQKLKGTCQTALASRNTYCKRMSFFWQPSLKFDLIGLRFWREAWQILWILCQEWHLRQRLASVDQAQLFIVCKQQVECLPTWFGGLLVSIPIIPSSWLQWYPDSGG